MEDYKELEALTSSSLTINEEYMVQSQKSNACSDHNAPTVTPKIPASSTKSANNALDDDLQFEDCDECNESFEPYCHVKLNSIVKLKNSTKKLLNLLDEIQSKTHTKRVLLTLEHFIKTNPIPTSSAEVSDNVSFPALRKLENQTTRLEAIYPNEDDDCSIYKRLTRKCQCLNQVDYNDFIIHFNEETKYSSSNIGELIKNLRILKKFLYMGGVYTNNALMFLNEGLSDGPHSERIEITQGCTHADVCNIFGDNSLVITCISWPCKQYYFGGVTTQALAASLINKLAQIEEGRRYLNFSTRITNDIRKVLRKKGNLLEADTINILNETLNLLKPPFSKSFNISCLNKPIYEGFGYKTINDLLKFRHFMILDEILTHLDLLKNFSNNDIGKIELTNNLPSILVLFKNMVVEFDHSEMNIIITHILINIVSNNMVKSEKKQCKDLAIADTATEPIEMKHELIQMPPKQKNPKRCKLKLSLGVSPTNNRHSPIRQVSGWEPPALCSRTKKLSKNLRRSIIVVPMEK